MRLRRLRGLVAAELAASGRHDGTRIVVQRAELSLDSDLTPEPELLVRGRRAPCGWLIYHSLIVWRTRQFVSAQEPRRISFGPMRCRG
jgi:hypothetical protein